MTRGMEYAAGGPGAGAAQTRLREDGRQSQEPERRGHDRRAAGATGARGKPSGRRGPPDVHSLHTGTVPSERARRGRRGGRPVLPPLGGSPPHRTSHPHTHVRMSASSWVSASPIFGGYSIFKSTLIFRKSSYPVFSCFSIFFLE